MLSTQAQGFLVILLLFMFMGAEVVTSQEIKVFLTCYLLLVGL